MSAFTFVVEKPCPICEKTTRIVKIKSKLPTLKVDEDFCIHYKDFNPYFYRIWYCEHCGYAADEKTFLNGNKIPKQKRKKLLEYLIKKKIHLEFLEERAIPDAVAAYKLAIHYEDITEGSFCAKAIYYHSMAWMYRLNGNEPEKEIECMKKAAENYDMSLLKERYPIGHLSDNTVFYLIGAIYYRIGEKDRAGQYLSRIASDQKVKAEDKNIYNKARDLWQLIREEKKEKEKQETKKITKK